LPCRVIRTTITSIMNDHFMISSATKQAPSLFPTALRPASPAELGERAVRMVKERAADHTSEWAAMRSIAEKVGCTPETLRLRAREAERDRGERAGLTTDERDRLKALERENRELRQANEILRKASAYFAAAELDRRFKP